MNKIEMYKKKINTSKEKKMIGATRFFRIVFGFIVCVLFWGCSSSPKITREVTEFRDGSAEQLKMGSRVLLRGDLDQAAVYMEEAIRLAWAADDVVSVVRSQIGRGSVYFANGEVNKARDIWSSSALLAKTESFKVGESAAKLFSLRSKLAEGNSDKSEVIVPASEIIEEIKKLTDEVSGDFSFYTAGLQIQGLAYKEIGLKDSSSFSKAISVLEKVADLHTSSNYFEDAAYDLYMLSSVFSRSGDNAKAVLTLQRALENDRKAENSWGLAADWLAIAKIQEKMKEMENAENSAKRSLEIARASFLSDAIGDAQYFLDNLYK